LLAINTLAGGEKSLFFLFSFISLFFFKYWEILFSKKEKVKREKGEIGLKRNESSSRTRESL